MHRLRDPFEDIAGSCGQPGDFGDSLVPFGATMGQPGDLGFSFVQLGDFLGSLGNTGQPGNFGDFSVPTGGTLGQPGNLYQLEVKGTFGQLGDFKGSFGKTKGIYDRSAQIIYPDGYLRSIVLPLQSLQTIKVCKAD